MRRRHLPRFDGGRDVAIQLAIAPDRATLADAWMRLTEAFGAVDPRSIEIEIRPPRPRRPAAGAATAIRPGSCRWRSRSEPRRLLGRFPLTQSSRSGYRCNQSSRRPIRLCQEHFIPILFHHFKRVACVCTPRFGPTALGAVVGAEAAHRLAHLRRHPGREGSDRPHQLAVSTGRRSPSGSGSGRSRRPRARRGSCPSTSAGLPDEERAPRPARRVELRPARRRPAALPPDPVHHLRVRRVEDVRRLLAGLARRSRAR